MHTTFEVKAEKREKVGKGAARALRRNAMIPAVIYGDKKDPLPIALPYKETFLALHAGGFMTNIATITVDGEKISVLPRDFQLDPVRDFLEHVDFLRVSKNTRVTVEIPVHFENEEASPGLKRGGVLNIVRHAVEVHCPASSIPEAFTIDLTGTEIGDTLAASKVSLPSGVEFTITDRDFAIATIATPAALRSEEDEQSEGEAPEDGEVTETKVINQKDDNVEGETKAGEE
ncbi:50S ribosomal protein L25/general stress protein Ctc [Fulvimarina sp. 2208YS6-2-32]|uniref:Large ribosomal subunit protein bL25 n=1 Tax=Fulvimarina uroteuthidis TaxID=3098149 RepID=A0ABU5I287_9HYPH|nr:50S ribosomal protein L25/general stress protein Ctc [Fulvimarina sp. 2208YS6-2-32]MDY8109487.1 50S ribosomal protein L25/general stress protein Ctc [Fulvimarina sp. 2208YS6-2-32]